MLFEDGATVTIGGAPATSVDVVNSTTITRHLAGLAGRDPQRGHGHEPGGTAGTLPNGWIANFIDVPNSQQFYHTSSSLVANGITAGCATPGGYCPLNSVTRAQMAVFLLKSKLGQCFVPPACTGHVPRRAVPSNPFAPWIEELSERASPAAAATATTARTTRSLASRWPSSC